MNQDNEKPTSRGLLVSVIAVSLLGLVSAVYLSQLHWAVHNLPGHVSFCAISERLNCDTVSVSSYSSILGVPVSTWGVLYYLSLIVVSLWAFFSKRSSFPWALLGAATAGALVATALLFMISQLVIRAFCIMCMSLYLVNIVTGFFSVFGLRRVGTSFTGSAAVLVAAVGSGMLIFLIAFPAYLATGTVVVTAGVWAAVAALLAAGGGRGISAWLRGLGQDIASMFSAPVGATAFFLVLAGVVVALLVVTPRFYTQAGDAIAGGVDNIGRGHTHAGHNWIGATEPEIIVTEYSDYECPFCRRAHETIRKLVRENKDWLRMVHVHVPLDHSCNPAIRRPFHRHACDCARAAICADRQNSFWEMNDRLFLRRCGLGANGLAMLAGKIGLDVEEFRKCMRETGTQERLSADLQECSSIAKECREMGRRFGTPTFTIRRAGDSGDQGSAPHKVVVGAKRTEFWKHLLQEIRGGKSAKRRVNP